MSKLTGSDLIELIKERFTSPEVYSADDYSHPINAFGQQDYTPEALKLGEIKEVDHYGGEGKGDSWWTILYFEDYDIYLKITGFYTSYSGVDFYDGWGCLKEVSPKSKTITVYE